MPIQKYFDEASQTWKAVDSGAINDGTNKYTPADIKNITTQLAETTTLLSGTNQGEKINLDGALRLGLRKKQPIISFVSDDGTVQDWTRLKPIFEAAGVPCGIAIVSSFIGTSGFMDEDAIRILHDDLGWEVMSHTNTHIRLANLTTEAEIDNELRIPKEVLESKGFKVNTVIYPYGSEDARVRKIARKYYRCGAISYNGRNEAPLSTYRLNRVAIGSYFDAGTDTNTYEYYKSHVDAALANNEWLIFQLHPAHSDFNATQQQYLADIINYIKSLNIPIMNMNEAMDVIGNLVDTGDYVKGQSNPYFVVGADGTGYSNDNRVRELPKTGININTPVTTFPTGISVTNFLVADGSGFPSNQGGILETYRFGVNDLHFQIWYPHNSNEVYKRRWVVFGQTPAWGAFEQIDAKGANKAPVVVQSLSFGTINPNSTKELTITFAGAKALTDVIVVNPIGGFTTDVMYTAFISADDTIRVRIANPTTISITVTDRNWKFMLLKG
ncbi:polysaccharide deacetylase family protein [Fictibacillus nanhaiensis]|uniref:polysaccharide deacetylase family protein n=1 Tax=Fictibacillus nanhaiensis TaxID=742169 RepID=UPI002E1FE52D|nr:polysaccharide deacetylase family protein [Fictibacillus nanhaiensis]MED1863212.1 polysaccharide deacetylase family protein [Fictibacillus nanhaiensis]